MDLDLETLKQDILAYLNSSEFAVFRSMPGALEGSPLVLWDVERYPDYQMFLDVARKAGVKLVLFASSELQPADLDELQEQMEEAELTRDEEREFKSRLRELRAYEGVTCSLELAFDLNARMYVYDLQPDWYDDFVNLEDDILAHIPDDDEDDESLGGYYSKN